MEDLKKSAKEVLDASVALVVAVARLVKALVMLAVKAIQA